VDQKSELNQVLLSQAASSPLLAAYLELNHLKEVYRQGWLRRGLPPARCESVADHILGVAMLAWWSCEQFYPALNSEKALRIALVHDLGEIYVGDLIPADSIAIEEKHRRERAAVRQVLGKLAKGPEYLALWEEYEAGESAEARLVRELDRLEMAFQALVYERGGLGNLDEFFRSASQAIQAPEIQDLFISAQNLRHQTTQP
jgi:putative hydrolases of HD superfamily